MWLNPPTFWTKPKTLTSLALQPIATVYSAIRIIRNRSITPVAVDKPVICIGNITTGGAGKTPVAIAIQKLLRHQGFHPCFLSRGYGGKLDGPHLVNPNMDTAHDVGDEPLLLCQYAPAWISKKRVAGAQAAIHQGANIIIMDDGFQNPSLKKDLSLLVIDGSYGIGNGCTLPAGPLRETLASALSRTDAVVIIGKDIHNITADIPPSIPILTATIQPRPSHGIQNQKCVAFAGIGHPEKFFSTLESVNAKLMATYAFPDHYPYSTKDIERMASLAKAKKALLVTTEKDWVRLPKQLRKEVVYLPIDIIWDDETKVIHLLKKYSHSH